MMFDQLLQVVQLCAKHAPAHSAMDLLEELHHDAVNGRLAFVEWPEHWLDVAQEYWQISTRVDACVYAALDADEPEDAQPAESAHSASTAVMLRKLEDIKQLKYTQRIEQLEKLIHGTGLSGDALLDAYKELASMYEPAKAMVLLRKAASDNRLSADKQASAAAQLERIARQYARTLPDDKIHTRTRTQRAARRFDTVQRQRGGATDVLVQLRNYCQVIQSKHSTDDDVLQCGAALADLVLELPVFDMLAGDAADVRWFVAIHANKRLQLNTMRKLARGVVNTFNA